jgi:autotransporter-associated beta strand protein
MWRPSFFPLRTDSRLAWRIERLEDRIVPADFRWDGRPDAGGVSVDTKWSTATNWVGDVAPPPGSDLEFPAGADQLVNVNDFAAGTAFGSITFTGYNYLISGNRVVISGGVNANLPMADANGVDPRLLLDLTLAAPQTFLVQSTTPVPSGRGYTIVGTIDLHGNVLTVSGDGSSTFAGPVAGAGGLVKLGDGTLELSGNNTYTGLTEVRAGQLRARTDSALGATAAGNETIVRGLGSLHIAGLGIDLVGTGLHIAEPITFADQFPSLFVESNFVVTLSGPLILAASGSKQVGFTVDRRSTLTITHGVGEAAPGNHLVLSGTRLNLGDNPSVDSTIVFAPSSVNAYTGGTAVVNQVQVRFDGQSGGTGLLTINGGSVGGTGTVGPVVVGLSDPMSHLSGPVSSRVAPGDPGAAGTLTTGEFTLNPLGQLVIDPLGNMVKVQGTVTLGGFLDVRPPEIEPAVVLPPGIHYRIIDNDGSDPVQGTFARLPEGAVVRTPAHVYRVTYHGGDGNDVELFTDGEKPAVAIGAGEGGVPVVNVYGGNGALLASLNAYDQNFRGGVRVATADVTGDGIEDVITAAGTGGGPHVKVFDGAALVAGVQRELYTFMAYDPTFTGGVFVAGGDVNGDGFADLVTGAGSGGGPHIKVFSGRDGSLLGQFMAYDPSFRGGATVAVFGREIVTGPGPGGGPHVRIFSRPDGSLSDEFTAFDPNFRGGIVVSSAGSVNGNIVDSIVVGAGPGQAPQVIASFVIAGPHRLRATLADFPAYDPAFRGGVRVAAADFDGDGVDEVMTGAGPGGGPHVEAWNLPPSLGQIGPSVAASFFAFDPAFRGGVWVG